MVDKPTTRLMRGEVGKASFVLSLPDIRNAEILTQESVFQTADGDVIGREGDIAITAYGGERYPIARTVFFGAYEVLGQVGQRLIARRLIHVRTAWPVLSDDAEFDYGIGRGVTSVTKGGWLYQSDEDDFGVINAKVKHVGHVEVGEVASVTNVAWRRRFESMSMLLTFLPPVLTLLALSALEATSFTGIPWISSALIEAELALLIAGVTCVAWMRVGKWNLKAAVSAGVSVGATFQVATELLGQKGSDRFPNMTLWRAAQMDSKFAQTAKLQSPETRSRIVDLRARIAATLNEMEGDLKVSRRTERLATAGEVAAVVIVVIGNVCLIASPHQTMLELFSIWLPSLIGALHALVYRKRASESVGSLLEFTRQLVFIKTQLQAADASSDTESSELPVALESAIRLLCRVVGQHCQKELRQAIAERPELPV